MTTTVLAAPDTKTMGAQAMGIKFGGFFSDQQKQEARKAFAQKHANAKECPPGLQRKGTACGSPWDTRYWAVGQELQPAVQVYPVAELTAALPPVPKGYEYVRAADDILLISSGTKLVVDMIEHVAS
ncbi:MAG: hypothetical protein H7255_03470 [Ramlibacter sp.]|nr:hypothetical protein [Ramlibacter sp.]